MPRPWWRRLTPRGELVIGVPLIAVGFVLFCAALTIGGPR